MATTGKDADTTTTGTGDSNTIEKNTSTGGCHSTHPYLLLFILFAETVLFIVVLALKPERPQLAVLSFIAVLLILIATCMIYRAPTENIRGLQAHQPDIGSWFMFFGFLSLSIQLFIRLVYSPVYGGNFQDFNYGLKCLHDNETQTPAGCKNLAFETEFNSYGHMVQGMFSLFLSPSIHVILRDKCSKCTRTESLLGVTDLLPLGTIIYPTYNIIKRVSYVNGYSFAVSSFCNNGAEWAFGFLFGVHFGIIGEAYAVTHNLYNHPNLLDPAEQLTLMSLHHLEHKSIRQTKFMERYQHILKWIRIFFGVCFFIMSIVAGVLFGLTWDTSLKEGGVSEDPDDTLATMVMVMVPIVLWVSASCILGRKYRSLQERIRIEKKRVTAEMELALKNVQSVRVMNPLSEPESEEKSTTAM